MRKILICLAALAVLGLTTLPIEAAKPGKAERAEKRAAARMLGRFDRDRSGSIDTSEAQRVRMAFAALKNLDTDKNGELSDSEITSAKVAKRRGKGGKKSQ